MIRDAIVVGGGITGLSAAYELRRSGADVLLLEAAGRVGGSIHTDRTSEGLLLESGPNTLTGSEAGLAGHLEELGLGPRVVAPRSEAYRRYVVHRGRPIPLPRSPLSFLSSPLLSFGGKVRLAGEFFRPRGEDPEESVYDFARRRLGREAADRLVDPFVSGIHAGNPDELSIRAAFPRIWEAEQRSGSVTWGLLTGRRSRPRRPRGSPPLFSFDLGMSVWPEALADRLGAERIRLGAQVTAIFASGGGGWVVEEPGDAHEARALVLALPAHEIAHLIQPLDVSAAAALRKIPYAPVAVVHAVYRREAVEHPLDGFGLLCPYGEERRILGSLWPSSLFPGRAPEGYALTTTFVGGARAPERVALSDEELTALVTEELGGLLGARGTPEWVRVVRWPRAIPQYVRRHPDRIARVEALEERLPGLRLAGSWRGGISAAASWASGRAVGKVVLLRSGVTPERVAMDSPAG